MPGSLEVFGPDGPNIKFTRVDLDGDPPYLSDTIDVSIINTGDTALTHLEVGDAALTGHLELSADGETWAPSLSFNDPLMPGQSKSIFARASFEGGSEKLVEIQIAAQARSVPVEVAQIFNGSSADLQ